MKQKHEELYEISSSMAKNWFLAGLFNILTNGGQRQSKVWIKMNLLKKSVFSEEVTV